MKRWMRAASLLLCLALLCGAAGAAVLPEAQTVADAAAELGLSKPGKLLAAQEMMPAGTSACDWLAVAFALGGVQEEYDAYLSALSDYVQTQYEQQGCLDQVKATEYQRIALTVRVLGGDPTAFSKDADGNPVNLLADGAYNFAGDLGGQGLNGWIFALIALDSGDYEVPADAKYSRETIRNAIVDAQEPDGGFGLDTGDSDVDLTAMALQALAPYKEECGDTIEKALAYLAAQINENCCFVSFDEENVEASAQVVIALCALGIDPEQDARFTKGDRTLLTGIARFKMDDGLYCHALADGESNLMASEQAVLALEAVERFHADGGRLYDFTKWEGPEADSGSNAVVYIVIGAVVVLGAGIAGFIGKKRKKK